MTTKRLAYPYLVLGALLLVTLAVSSTPERARALGGSTQVPTCYDCSAGRFVTWCSGCSTSNGGGQCNNCGSCANSCGGQGDNGSCWCDTACTGFGDCCHDYKAVCSCEDMCDVILGGALQASIGRTCYCDAACHYYGDCCDDKIQWCCDSRDEPGTNGNAFCFEGHACCDGEWQCGSHAAEQCQ